MIINFKLYESLTSFYDNIKLGDIYVVPIFSHTHIYFIYYEHGVFIDLKCNYHYFLDVHDNKGEYYTLENYYQNYPDIIKNIFLSIKKYNINGISKASHEIYKNWIERIPDLSILKKSVDFNL